MDTMISMIMTTPHEMTTLIATKAKAKRLAMNLSQINLAKRSGVSYGTLKKFEQTGQISLESLLKLALVLSALEGFGDLFAPLDPTTAKSLDELMQDKTRKRGRG
jgi:transcriptional regulator with XRE-family HTH domain